MIGLCIFLISGFDLFTSDLSKVSREIAFGIPSLMVVYGLLSLDQYTELRWPRWLVAIGDASYSIYLCHIFVLSACVLIWKKSGLHNDLSLIVALVIMFILSIFSGFASYRYVERPLQRKLKQYIR